VAIVGPSGAGKSSLVRAGVIPALARSGAGWDVHVVRPGRAPLAALALLDTTSGALLGPVIERLRAQPGYLRARLGARAAHRQRRILVFVDQLEELYTLGATPDERAAFLACLAAVACAWSRRSGTGVWPRCPSCASSVARPRAWTGCWHGSSTLACS
jgi:hypothetical protein